jgi:membrane-bound lytic murein transglycosylase D
MKSIIITYIAICLSFVTFAEGTKDNTGGIVTDKDTTTYDINNEPFITIIDSVIFNKLFDNTNVNLDIDSLNVYNYSPEYIPEFSDLVLECRMMEIDKKTPIQLDYNNIVDRYIDVYTVRKRKQMGRMLGLAQLYYPIFEECLAKYDLPIELKHLAIVESALNPLAKSKSGATGLWQFMYHSSRMFDLHIDSYVDERRDPYKSTEAACRYLNYLYRIFNDWQLALAAYNGGPGVVRNAIQRSGKSTFWEIRPYLPTETQNYVPAFIAVNYAMNYTTEHNIFPVAPKLFFRETDTVRIVKPLYFSQISKALGIPKDILLFLNPSFKTNYIAVYDKKVKLILPADKVADFISKEEQLYNAEKPLSGYAAAPAAGSKENKIKIEHVVQKGEFLHQIAMNYLCTVDDIKVWNELTTTFLYAGRKLDIWLDADMAKKQENNSVVQNEKEGDYIYYTVKEGDTLKEIASKFNCGSERELMYLNNINENNQMKPGMKLKVFTSAN